MVIDDTIEKYFKEFYILSTVIKLENIEYAGFHYFYPYCSKMSPLKKTYFYCDFRRSWVVNSCIRGLMC